MCITNRFSRSFLLPLVLLTLVLAGAFTFVSTRAHAALRACQSYNVSNLALGAGQPANNTIYGELCHPATGPSHTVQLLISGVSYSHLYWDWPQTPGLYSAVSYFTGEGYSTFNIDRIGIGNSSHPASSSVTLQSNAYIVHELVGRLKAGTIGGVTFSRVILVGHSFGSYVSISEETSYHDVDGIVLTGYTHLLNPGTVTLLVSETIPANTDPSGRFSGLDSGYLTTAPGTRGGVFYYQPGKHSNPDVIAYDEQTKQTYTAQEVAGITTFPNNLTQQINVPVLEVVGQEDALYCGQGAVDCSSNASVSQEESPFFSPSAQLQVQVIPVTGHDLNLHLTAQETYSAIIAWSKLHVPSN